MVGLTDEPVRRCDRILLGPAPDISGNRAAIGRHFGPLHLPRGSYSDDMHSWAFAWQFLCRLTALAALCVLPAGVAHAQDPIQQQARQFAAASLQLDKGSRVEVEVGALDPRLRLAPCEDIQPYLPPNVRLWGRSRIGIRCLRGATRWNVYLPVTVKVYATALVARRALPVGSTMTEDVLTQAEVDLAEEPSHALLRPEQAVGRTLVRPVEAGRSLRLAHLQPRQWFAAGDTVQVVAQGSGFRVAAEGQALTPGKEGQPARVRTESGRVLTADPVGERRVELRL